MVTSCSGQPLDNCLTSPYNSTAFMARYSSWWKNLVAFGVPSSKFGKGICIIKYGALTMDFTSGINSTFLHVRPEFLCENKERVNGNVCQDYHRMGFWAGCHLLYGAVPLVFKTWYAFASNLFGRDRARTRYKYQSEMKRWGNWLLVRSISLSPLILPCISFSPSGFGG